MNDYLSEIRSSRCRSCGACHRCRRGILHRQLELRGRRCRRNHRHRWHHRHAECRQYFRLVAHPDRQFGFVPAGRRDELRRWRFRHRVFRVRDRPTVRFRCRFRLCAVPKPLSWVRNQLLVHRQRRLHQLVRAGTDREDRLCRRPGRGPVFRHRDHRIGGWRGGPDAGVPAVDGGRTWRSDGAAPESARRRLSRRRQGR